MPKENMTRRDFIKKTTKALGGIVVSGEFLENVKENGLQEKTVKGEIEKCTQIIRNEQYEKVLGNPYLVSTLFYSKEAIQNIKPPHEYPAEEIIVNIYPLITKQFREKYITFLTNLVRDTSLNQENMNMEGLSFPLDNLDWRDAEYNHEDALDLFTEEGSPIYSISGGIVVLAENGWRMGDKMSTSSMRGGNTIIIFNPQEESFYRYAHLQKTIIEAGTILPSGTRIGTVGHTGINASKRGHGGHLHLEMNRYDRKEGAMTAEHFSEIQKMLKILQG
jgi:murein DD-endopeptidase MepM/ murein hydrolase activator NlpD